MDSLASRPYISVITSCSIRNSQEVIARLCERGEGCLDLYVFQDDDPELLQGACEGPAPQTVTELVRRMDPVRAAAIVRQWLPDDVRIHCQVPYSPFRALATNFADISSPDEARRRSIRDVLFKCAQLAAALGATCVEIVGGPSFRSKPSGEDIEIYAGTDIVQERLDQLKKTLRELDDSLDKANLPVGIALELEPGPAYLLNSIKRIQDVVLGNGNKYLKHIGINVDIGHLLLLSEQPERQSPDNVPLSVLRSPDMMKRIMHFHISDHSLSHFCDLELASFHPPDKFIPWIELYLDTASSPICNPFFTNTIAIEMEASQSIDQALRSMQTLRTWLTPARLKSKNFAVSSGLTSPRQEQLFCVILFVDIVSSTNLLLSLQPDEMNSVMSSFVQSMERLVTDHGGFFDKFTGDGFMALFGPHRSTEDQAALVKDCLRCTHQVRDGFSQVLQDMNLSNRVRDYRGSRIGIACGKVHFGMMNNSLRAQVTAVGKPVVEAARILGVCGGNQTLVSDQIRQLVSHDRTFLFRDHGQVELKGLDNEEYLLYEYNPGPLP
jgi:class 3 adenylate cyclase